jgi:benzylsuccinate CoA-transferase BbsF subunit
MNTNPLPLAGYRVIDFSWVWAGPLLGSLLADMGAEVIKVESRRRLDTHRWTADNIERDPEKDFYFHSINRNKLGITLNLTKPEAISVLKRLVKISDVVIENFSAGVMERLGLGYESLREVNPPIIMISLPPAGHSGPLSDITTYAPTLAALAGLSSMVGYAGERVLGIELGIGDPNSAVHGAFAVLSALYYRDSDGGDGQHIELSQQEALVSVLGEAILGFTMNGEAPGSIGNRHPTMAPHNNYRCEGDKWVSIAVSSEEEWRSLCQVIGNPPWTREEQFNDMYKRLANQEELDKLVTDWTKNHTHYEVAEILQQAGVAAAPCLDIEERFLDPHLREREVYATVDHPAVGMEWVAGVPIKISETPAGVYRAAPMLGQHNEYVFKELLGMPDEEIAQLTRDEVAY